MISTKAAVIGILLAQATAGVKQPERVSMIRLLSGPASYNQKHVIVICYIFIEGNEDRFLFLHCDDLQNGNLANSLRLDPSTELPTGVRNGALVGVEGTFVLDKEAVSERWNPGRLSRIVKIGPWPLAAQARCSR